MKLFDQTQLLTYEKKRKAHAVAFCCVAVLLVVCTVLCFAFVKSLTRTVAQILATVCVVALGCYSVAFGEFQIFWGRMIALCKSAEEADEICFTVVEMDTDVTTYRYLPFFRLEAQTKDGVKQLYLWQGSLEKGKTYQARVAQNVICEIKEQEL